MVDQAVARMEACHHFSDFYPGDEEQNLWWMGDTIKYLTPMRDISGVGYTTWLGIDGRRITYDVANLIINSGKPKTTHFKV